MAAIADIVLNDSVPAARTFKPSWKDGLLARWQEETPATVDLYPTITVGMRAPKPGVTRKITLKVIVPYETTVDSVTVREANSCFIDFLIPESADATDVDDLRSYVSEAVENAVILDVIDEGKFPY